MSTEEIIAVSLRNVKKDVWKDFKKLAVLNDLTLAEYLEKVVKGEMEHVHIGKDARGSRSSD